MTDGLVNSELITYSRLQVGTWPGNAGLEYIRVKDTGAKSYSLLRAANGSPFDSATWEFQLTEHNLVFFNHSSQYHLYRLIHSDDPSGLFDRFDRRPKRALFSEMETLTDKLLNDQLIKSLLITDLGQMLKSIPNGLEDVILCKSNLGKLIAAIRNSPVVANEIKPVYQFPKKASETQGNDIYRHVVDHYLHGASVKADNPTRVIKATNLAVRSALKKGLIPSVFNLEDISGDEAAIPYSSIVQIPVSVRIHIGSVNPVASSVEAFKSLPSSEIPKVLRFLLKNSKSSEEAITTEKELKAAGFADFPELLNNLIELIPESLKSAGAMVYIRKNAGSEQKVIINPKHVAFLKLWATNADPVLIGSTLGLEYADQGKILLKLGFDLKMNNDQLKAWFLEAIKK